MKRPSRIGTGVRAFCFISPLCLWLISQPAAPTAMAHDLHRLYALVARLSDWDAAMTLIDNTTMVVKHDSRVKVLTSKLSTVDFVPDGDLSKAFWESAPKVRFDQGAFNKVEYPASQTVVASLWTRNYLYLAYWCDYDSLNVFHDRDPDKERWGLWERDVVEAFISPVPFDSDHYFEFEIAPNNEWLDLEINLKAKLSHNASWNSGFQHATKIDARRHVWTVELRIPVKSMGVQNINANATWRINLYRVDGAGSGENRRFLSWSPLPILNHSFHQPASFGILKFVK